MAKNVPEKFVLTAVDPSLLPFVSGSMVKEFDYINGCIGCIALHTLSFV